MKRIFVSSVQKEFAKVRKQFKRFMSKNPAYRRLFETFVFEEDVVACDRRTDELYIEELRKCDIYVGLIGNEYGYEDAEGVSPTEREFDEATQLGLTRLMFVLGKNNDGRSVKEIAFLKKVSDSLIRARCEDESELLPEIIDGLDNLLLEQGAYRVDPVVDDSRSEFVLTIKRNPIEAGGKETTNKQQIKKIKNSDIVALIIENPTLSIEKLANKQQITVSALRTKIESFKRSGILKREGSRKNGRWVFTSKFGGCSADGDALIKEDMEFDRDLLDRVQGYADSRGIPVSVAIHELIASSVKDEP